MTCISHIPGFVLTETDEASIGGLQLRHLTFDEWREIDHEFPYQARAFERSRPLFVLDDSDIPWPDAENGNEDQLAGFAFGPAATAHLALNLRNPHCARHAAPALSMTYLRRGPAVLRLVGPLDREAVVWGIPGQPAEGVPNSELEATRYLYRLFERAGTLGPANVLVEALEATSRPDTDEVTGFCLCVAALDMALASDQVGEIRTTFTRRVAAAATDSASDHDKLADLAADYYQLRSEIVHGRVRPKTLDKLGLPSLEYLPCVWARNIVRPVLLRLLGLGIAGVTDDELPGLLDAAAADERGRQALAFRVNQGWQIPDA